MNLWGNGYDFARIWQSAEKTVFSTTLTSVSTTNTRIERVFDAEAVRLDPYLTSNDLIEAWFAATTKQSPTCIYD
jgi:hypothetical protein